MANEAKFTPGPWTPEYGHNGYPRGVIQSEGVRSLFAHDRSREEREANARLIAAAPSLLEAAQELIGFLGAGPDGDSEDEKLERRLLLGLRAAISKATTTGDA